MNLNFNKYEGLSMKHKQNPHQSSSSPPKQTSFPPKMSNSTVFHMEFPTMDMYNQPGLTQSCTGTQMKDWRRSLPNCDKYHSVSVVEYKKASNTLQPNNNPYQKRTNRSRQSVYNSKLGISLTKNNTLQNYGVEEARRIKQLTELKHRIINLPNSAIYSSNRCLTDVIQQLTSSAHPSSKNVSIKKAMNFRLKLKRPQLMKQELKQKIQRVGNKTAKTEGCSQERARGVIQLFTDQRASTTKKTYRKRSTLRTKASKMDSSPVTIPVDTVDIFEIEPWRIEL